MTTINQTTMTAGTKLLEDIPGLQLWYQASTLDHLGDDSDVLSWNPRHSIVSRGITAMDEDDAPTYQVGVSYRPSLLMTGTYGVGDLGDDNRNLCPGANESLLAVQHIRVTDINDVSISLLAGAPHNKNAGGSTFKGWDFIPVGSSGDMRFRIRGTDGSLVQITSGGAFSADTDYIVIAVREHGEDKVHLWIQGSGYTSGTFDNAQSTKHASTTGAFVIGNYPGAANTDYALEGYTGDAAIWVRSVDFTNNEVNRVGSFFAKRYNTAWGTVTQLAS